MNCATGTETRLRTRWKRDVGAIAKPAAAAAAGESAAEVCKGRRKWKTRTDGRTNTPTPPPALLLHFLHRFPSLAAGVGDVGVHPAAHTRLQLLGAPPRTPLPVPSGCRPEWRGEKSRHREKCVRERRLRNGACLVRLSVKQVPAPPALLLPRRSHYCRAAGSFGRRRRRRQAKRKGRSQVPGGLRAATPTRRSSSSSSSPSGSGLGLAVSLLLSAGAACLPACLTRGDGTYCLSFRLVAPSGRVSTRPSSLVLATAAVASQPQSSALPLSPQSRPAAHARRPPRGSGGGGTPAAA